ncbi:MAG: molybdopterin-synthase adenylyltransferase MoeB [Alphaproteobacteria bacterium]
MPFDEQQMLRYARHIVLPEVGGAGQAKLLAARVLVIGAGGLGSPLLLYLAAAGIGRLGIVDDDRVDLSNLHRQIAHPTDHVGLAKTSSAKRAAHALNPEIEIVLHEQRLTSENAAGLVADYDLVADGSDNFATRDAVHQACFDRGKPLVSAAVQGVEGQLSTYKAHLGAPHPCYRCVFPEHPPADLIPTCAEGGVLGPVVGVMGSLQAVEVVKELLGRGDSLSGTLLLYDALSTSFSRIAVKRRPGCPVCGGAAQR